MNEHEPATTPPHLAGVELHEYSELLPRPVALTDPRSLCGALPARAFRARYPDGCLRVMGHPGPHSAEAATARRADRAALRRAAHE